MAVPTVSVYDARGLARRSIVGDVGGANRMNFPRYGSIRKVRKGLSLDGML